MVAVRWVTPTGSVFFDIFYPTKKIKYFQQPRRFFLDLIFAKGIIPAYSGIKWDERE